MTTQKEIRKAFWNENAQFQKEYRSNKRQNEYNCTIRSYFVEYVDYLCKSGVISAKLANRVTL